MGYNRSFFKGGEEDVNKLGNNPDYPVENVSWNMAQEFISKLNEKNDGFYYRLPTEAEWEYAARAGTKTAYSFGDNAALLKEHGWHNENSSKTTHPVASCPTSEKAKPNGFGLYDIHGNVWEWVSDGYGAYPSERVMDPPGPSSGSYHVVRGGSWFNAPKFLRSASRVGLTPDTRGSDVGLRMVRVKKVESVPVYF
jgi:formylglycine-generating enzyme required for sulfatase activity